MSEKKQWFTSEVNSLLEQLKHKCCTTFLSRVLLVYSETNKLMQLCEDHKRCESITTKRIIEKEMQSIVDELRHYKIFDDRFEEIFDSGR